MIGKILVTPRSLTRNGHPALARLEQAGYQIIFGPAGRQPDEAELLRLLPGCIGYLAGVERISAKTLEAAAGLKAISRNGTGIDGIDLEAAKRLGIAVLRADGANANGVAELTLGLIFALVRSIPFSDAHLKRGAWERREGIELDGKMLGLIGCGKVGCRVAKLAAGMGMSVLAYDPVLAPEACSIAGLRLTEMAEVFAKSDVVSLHCPPLAAGRALIDRQVIQLMKPGVFIINTARGELLDDAAVLEALEDGRIAGLALDAYRAEPPGDVPLIKHAQVIATPHIGAFTRESVERCVEAAIDNLLGFLWIPQKIDSKGNEQTRRKVR